MKKLILFLIILCSFGTVNAKENKYPKEVIEVLEVFIDCLNRGDDDIYSFVDSSNTRLIEDIRNQINDINVTYDIKYIRKKAEDYYRIKTIFDAHGEKWSTSGFSSWYDIKLIDGAYKIADTNLFKRTGFGAISTFGIIAFIAFPIIFVLPYLLIFFKLRKRNKEINNNSMYLSNQNKPL